MASSEVTRGNIDVLDDVLDKETGPKPKLVTQSGGVGSGVRHLAQDELDAYMNGRLAAARLTSCSTHLDACDACRAELEDLRNFKSSAAALSQSGSLGRELDRRKRQRQLKAAATAATVAVAVAAIAGAGWWTFGKLRVRASSVVAVRAAKAREAVSPDSQSRGTSVAQPHVAVATPRGTDVQPRSATPASSTPSAGTLQAHTVPVAQAHGTATPAVTPPPASTSFALLGPFGDEISDARPEFTWEPLAGATKYSIVIVDDGLRPVQHSRVKTTSWRPRRPLRRGRTYLWQVTATLRNGTKIVATGPTSLEARIHIAQPPSGKLADSKER